ncbi:MAG: hemerythrin domain-containing protein [Nitrososphaerota archaeon]|nr:hemerythrin domain-containing protein [Nitrososphaerota archaeon]
MPETAGRRYAPRKMNLGDLIKVLVKEHSVMQDGLEKAKQAAARRDFAGVAEELKKLDPIFRQHIADEESTILALLMRLLGKEGSAEEIRIFQQHRPIYQLMKTVGELAARSAVELEASQDELKRLFEQHAGAEESRVFPRASSLGG